MKDEEFSKLNDLVIDRTITLLDETDPLCTDEFSNALVIFRTVVCRLTIEGWTLEELGDHAEDAAASVRELIEPAEARFYVSAPEAEQ